MKKIYSLLLIVLGLISFSAFAQDEGEISKKERIGKSSNIFINGGPSFTFGNKIGDYSKGFNLEVGYMKRVNRLLSIGPSISYIQFKYDPQKTASEYYGSGDVDTEWYGSAYDGWFEKYPSVDQDFDSRYLLSLEGGNLSLISLSVNFKLNLVPVRDESPLSVYVFAKPFITSATRKAVTGRGTREVYEAYEEFFYEDYEPDDVLYYNTGDDTWYADGYSEDWGPDGFSALKEKKVVTGGVFVGPGIEFMPAKTISVYLQTAIGYTFPVSFVSTKSFEGSIDSYLDDEFPVVKKGFTSLNVQIGVSFNF